MVPIEWKDLIPVILTEKPNEKKKKHNDGFGLKK